MNTSQKGKGKDIKQDNVEYTSINCYNDTSGICFIKCIKNLTGKAHLNEVLTLLRDEQRRSNIMTSVTFQPFSK